MTDNFTIILFYKFIDITDKDKLRIEQRQLCEVCNLKGRMLIAEEGINATLEGKTADIDTYIQKMHDTEMFKDVVFKKSDGNGKGFSKLIVRVRPEIVTLESGKFDVRKETAKELSADELEQLYSSNEDFVVLDLRNDYEIEVGQFEKTVNLRLRNFRDLPTKLPELETLKNKKVVAVCTGGIRCEKATCLLQREGFTDIYQLKDGIHTYMQKYPGKRFKGSLFVFDNRMATPVVDVETREIIGECFDCHKQCEQFYSDDSYRPSRKVICCDDCVKKHTNLRSCIDPRV